MNIHDRPLAACHTAGIAKLERLSVRHLLKPRYQEAVNSMTALPSPAQRFRVSRAAFAFHLRRLAQRLRVVVASGA